MLEPQEFPPPFPSARQRPRRRQARGRNASLDSVIKAIAGDPAFFRMIADIANLPPEKRAEAVRSHYFWWNYLTGIERSKVVKGFRSGLYDREVADLAGVERETLGRDGGYKEFKRRLSAASQGGAKRRRMRGMLRRIDVAGLYLERHDDMPDHA